MGLNAQFWDGYIRKVVVDIENLLDENRDYYYVDMHIHSEYSDDGSLTIQEIIEFALENKLEIISITDHDSMKCYADLECEIIRNRKQGEKLPIIIPGVEFSVYYKEYGDLCHILKYFVNPECSEVVSDLLINEKAYWNRSKKQFSRIRENRALQYFVEIYSINFDFEEYVEFLNNNYKIPIPEYPNLIDYIYKKLSEKAISILSVLDKTEYYSRFDTCIQRKETKLKAIERFKSKYLGKDVNFDNSRLLLPILATVGIDDEDYLNHFSSGNLSITNYGQIKLSGLNKQGLTVFAHPTGSKLNLVDQLKDLGNLDGLEVNYRNRHASAERIIHKSKELGIFYTVGSDMHCVANKLHDNLNFYSLPRDEIKFLLTAIKSKLFKREHDLCQKNT